jgi:AraC family transcriptional regulator
VPSDWSATSELETREIRGGRDAVALHVGPYAELTRAYMWLLGTWLPQSGEEVADAPCVEEYLNDPRTLPPTEWRTEVWLPLR